MSRRAVILSQRPRRTCCGRHATRRPVQGPERVRDTRLHALAARAVRGALVDLGYKRDGRTHLRPLQPGVSFIVDTGPLGRRSDISPWVVLRNDQVEEAYSRFIGLPNDPFVGTVGANVGYIVDGTYRSWSGGEDVSSVTRAIDEAQRILAPFADLAKLSVAWKIRGTEAPGFERHLVVVHYLLGNRPEMDRWLGEAERLECRVEDGVCEQFRRFKANLLADARSKGS